jgi:D-3-phosphoglycerate dehydrogenase
MTLKICICDGLGKEGLQKLETHPLIEITSAKEQADIFVIRSATKLDRAAIDQYPNLKGVLRAGVGLDNIDIPYATELGIAVWNAPTGNFDATAELAWALLMACARNVVAATESARQGRWAKNELAPLGRQFSGSTLGVVGAGNIGSRVVKFGLAFGMNVLFYDPLAVALPGASLVSLEKLVQESDFVSLHMPLIPQTKGLFGDKLLAQMKPNAILVNAARGGLIDEVAVLQVLKEKKLGALGLDVFEKEPFDSQNPVTRELLSLPNVVATPHIGASTIESSRMVGLETAAKMMALAEGKTIPKPLNSLRLPRFSFLKV